MKPNTQLIRSVWENSKAVLSNKNIDLDKSKLDELIATIFSIGPFFYYIIDFADLKIKYMSPLVKEIHGLNPEDVIFEEILNQVHPDDMEFVAQAEAKVVHLLYNVLGKDKVTKYKMSYCFRCKTTDGSYQLFNHQALVLTTDEFGRTSKALNIHTNINHLTSVNTYKLSLIGISGEPSFSNIDVVGEAPLLNYHNTLFSKREKEIIRLLANGSTTSQIAEKLFIAHNTVKNHRKNILQKSHCKNVGQLISTCVTEGLI